MNGNLGWALVLALCAAYLAFFVQLTSFPLQDYPNHVARGAVMADLLFHHGARWGQQFTVQPMVVPYILGDLILAVTMELFGTVGGAGVFTGLVLLSLPCALLFYMRVNRLSPQARLLVFLVSLYLSTDWFLLMGFMAFRLAVAGVVFTLALADLLRARWSVPMFVVYVCALLLCYLAHLSWLVFFAVALGISGAFRWWVGTTSIRREIVLWVPMLVLLVWQFLFGSSQEPGAPEPFQTAWGGITLKLTSLLTALQGFGGHLAQPLIVLLALCIFWPIRRWLLQRQAWLQPAVLEQLAIVAAFLVIYIALPRELTNATYIDLRALPMLALFGIFAVLHVPPRDSAGREFATSPVLVLALLLATGNLTYLMYHIGQNNAWVSQYRKVVQTIPVGARVLSVYAERQADSRPFLHAGSFVVLDRGGITPYLFGGDRGDPMIYFRYRHRPYRPAENWYDAERLKNLTATGAKTDPESHLKLGPTADGAPPWYETTATPDWNRVACGYDFLLLTMPFDPTMIGVPAHTVASNQSAALLQVDTDKQNCPHGGETSS